MKITAMHRVLLLLTIVIALAACTQQTPPTTVPTTAPPEATAVPPTTAPTTAPEATEARPTAAPTEPEATEAPASGNVFSFNGIEFTIPEAVASGATAGLVPASQEEDAPEFAINPTFTEIILLDYPIQDGFSDAMIQVFPVAEYVEMSETAGQRVQEMQALLAEKPAAPEAEIPVLPLLGAAQVFHTQVQYLDFANGSGVRFVTLYAQGVGPVTNQEIFYTYQGLTSDGAYWVSARLPVNVAFLPADAEAAENPSADDVAFPGWDADVEQFESYYQAVADKLNAAQADEFTPDLTDLDAMMQSLSIVAP